MKSVELKQTDFDLSKKKLKVSAAGSSLKELNILFVYANWCGHCTTFKKIYTDAAKTIGSVVTFYKIDSDLSPDLMKSLKVNSFPSLFIINKRGDVVKKFNPDRTSLESFLGEVCNLAMNCPKKKI